jgi:DNA-binding response OmpR family regulator
MVIDDQPDTVMTLLELLREEGHVAMGHSSSREAMESLSTFLPDVVISDLAMPAPHGFDVAREVRKTLGPKPLLIAVTAQYTKPTDKVLAEVVGYDYYLIKPCDPNVLLALMDKARK